MSGWLTAIWFIVDTSLKEQLMVGVVLLPGVGVLKDVEEEIKVKVLS